MLPSRRVTKDLISLAIILPFKTVQLFILQKSMRMCDLKTSKATTVFHAPKFVIPVSGKNVKTKCFPDKNDYFADGQNFSDVVKPRICGNSLVF